jgi:hypothetical protein
LLHEHASFLYYTYIAYIDSPPSNKPTSLPVKPYQTGPTYALKFLLIMLCVTIPLWDLWLPPRYGMDENFTLLGFYVFCLFTDDTEHPICPIFQGQLLQEERQELDKFVIN